MEAAIQAVIVEDMTLKPRGTLNKSAFGFARTLDKKMNRISPNTPGKMSSSVTPPPEKRVVHNSPNSVRKMSPCLSRKEMKVKILKF